MQTCSYHTDWIVESERKKQRRDPVARSKYPARWVIHLYSISDQVSLKCQCWGISVFSRVELHPKGIFDMELESPSEKWTYWNLLLTYGNLDFVSLSYYKNINNKSSIFQNITIDDSSWDLLSTSPVLKLLSQKGSLLCNNRLQEQIT